MELPFPNDLFIMKLSELPESFRAERFYLFTEMLTDTCDRLLEQAARTEEEDKENKATVVTLFNL